MSDMQQKKKKDWIHYSERRDLLSIPCNNPYRSLHTSAANVDAMMIIERRDDRQPSDVTCDDVPNKGNYAKLAVAISVKFSLRCVLVCPYSHFCY